MSSGLIGLSTKTLRSVAPSSTWAASYLRPSSADFITTIAESSFQYTQRILALYSSYYNQTRTHLALRKDAPLRRAVQGSGTIIATLILFGLHHRYART